jgi:hypothetical protein
LHALLTSIVLPWLVPLLTFGAPWYFEDLARLRPANGAAEWMRLAVSALIGGLSHLLLDGFTHGGPTGWMVPMFPFLAAPVHLGRAVVPFHDGLHVTLTIVLGILGVRLAARIGRLRLLMDWYPTRESASREATRTEKRGALGHFVVCALIGVAAGAQRSHAHLEWIELGAFGVVAFTFYGLVLASVADRLRATWMPRKLELDATEAES